MVIGNGGIAKSFLDEVSLDNEVLIFASGVSNSKESNLHAFEREKKLLVANVEAHPDRLFVYFSTCSIYDPTERTSPYVKHKLKMEDIVQSSCPKFVIYRLSNVVSKTENKVTVFNFLINSIKHGIPFRLWKNAYRNIIDIDDVKKIVQYTTGDTSFHNQIINVANVRSYPVAMLVHEIENHFEKKAIYTLVDQGSYFEINLDVMTSFLNRVPVTFPDDYIKVLLLKYYATELKKQLLNS